MAETKKYYHNLDVDGNKVSNLILNPMTTVQKTALGLTLGIADKGYFVYDTTLLLPYYWDGTAWVTTVVIPGVTAVTASAPLSSTGGFTPNLSISQATTSTDGYLSSTDWNLFDGKQSALTFSLPLVNTLDVISIPAATTLVDGYLTAIDWTTFNSKFTLPSLTAGSVLFSDGTTIAQDNALFFWDDTNNRLGIGNAIPAHPLDVTGVIRGSSDAIINGLTVGKGFTNNASATAFGVDANLVNTSLYATAFGYQALKNNTSGGITAVGYQAGFNNISGGNNAAFGYQALYLNSTGSSNTALGSSCMTNATGSFNSAFGFQALDNVTSTYNVGNGYRTLRNLTSGGFNTAIGGVSSTNIGTGIQNVSIGYASLAYGTVGNANSNNTAIGFVSLAYMLGSNNAALGFQSGRYIANGSTNATAIDNSILIGYNTKVNANSQTNQIVIGYDETGLGSNTTILGNSSTITTAIRGNLLLGTTTDAGQKLQVTGTAIISSTTTLSVLAGVGSRMVVADALGELSTTAIPSLTGYVPYTGATTNLDLGLYNLTATQIIKAGGTSSQFLKADGSVDSTAYGTGTVTSVAALTLGTTGTDLSSTVATGTTTPVITLNVPTASATNRGVLSTTDWSAFNSKFTLPALTAGSVLFSNGTTIAQDNANFFWDDTNNRLGIGTISPSEKLSVSGGNFRVDTANAGRSFLMRSNSGTEFNIIAPITDAAFLGFQNTGDKYSIGVDTNDGALKFKAGFYTSAAETMRLTSTRKVSIGGLVAPTYRLDVYGTAATDAISTNVGLNFTTVGSAAAPTVTLAAGGSVDIGIHYYNIVFYNALGDSYIGSRIGITPTAGNQTVILTNIPISTDTTVIGRKVYRSKLGEGSSYGWLVGTIANNTTTTFTDTVADSTLTDNSGGYTKVNKTSNFITLNGSRSMNLDYNLTSFGPGAGVAITTGGGNTLFGANAGLSLTTGNSNTFVGQDCGRAQTTGSGNVAVGQSQQWSAIGGSYNVSMGNFALYAVTGSENVGIGHAAGGTLSSGWDNVFIGRSAGNAITTGGSNTLVGAYAGNTKNTSSTGNTALGINTLQAGGAANYNTAIGYQAGYANTTGGYNTYVGTNSGGLGTTGTQNVFLGNASGYRQTGSNILMIDVISRGSEALEQSSALIYGLFDATPGSQFLALGGGGNVSIGNIVNGGYKLDVSGTTRLVPIADASALVSTGYSVTGSGATSMIDLAGTWNTTGAPTALKLNITNTASGANALLMDLQVGGVSQFKVSKTGSLSIPWQSTMVNLGGGTYVFSSNGFTSGTPITIMPLGLTGSSALESLNITQTWNTTGNPTAIKLNVTNTASGASSNLMDLQTGGVSKFNVSKAGFVGIGVTPSQKLDVAGSINLSSTGNLYFGNGNSSIKGYDGATATNIIFSTFYSGSLSEKMKITTSGNVLIGTSTDVASSKLTVESTTQGFLPPRMTTTQRTAIATPATGLNVYDNTTNTNYVYNGTSWGVVVANNYIASAIDITATSAHNIIELTATGKTVTLPTAVGITGRQYIIKLTAAGVATIDGNGTETIDGNLTVNIAQWDALKIVSNGTNWIIL